MSAKVGSHIKFIRFNGASAEGRVKKVDRSGKRGPWLRVKVEGRAELMGVRPGQITAINGVAQL